MRVAYIQLDTPRSLWTDRILALQRAGLDTTQVWFADRETLDTYPFNILDPKHEAILAETVLEASPDVVIIDTLKECSTGAEENSNDDMQEVIAHLTAACQPAAIVFVHHAKKPPAEGSHSVINGARGASYLTGKMDSICYFQADSMTVIGRACEETKVPLEKVEIPGGFYWRPTRLWENRRSAERILRDPSLATLPAKARALAAERGLDMQASFQLLASCRA